LKPAAGEIYAPSTLFFVPTESEAIPLIELTRALARCYRIVLRRSLQEQEPRRSWPLLFCKADDGGLTLQSVQTDMALRFHQTGVRPSDLIAFNTQALAEFEGRTDTPVVLENIAVSKSRARWDDGGVPRELHLEAVAADNVPQFPEVPAQYVPMPTGFLTALDEASRTTGRDPGGRFGLTRIQLRGKRGDVVATDGRQLLVQAGFAFPWNDDVLIPRSSVFGCREFACDGEVLLGRTKTHVALQCGPWTLLLAIDGGSRYPDTEAIIPRTVSVAARLVLDDQDAAFLTAALPKLPGAGDVNSPITVDLNRQPAIRARGEQSEQVTEVPLARSTTSGPPMRLCVDRRLLHRSIALGFRELEAASADTPVVLREGRRMHLWVPLDKKGAIAPGADVIRVGSTESAVPLPSPPIPNRKEVAMSEPTNNGHSPESRVRDPQLEKWDFEDVIAEAEALRTVMQDANARTTRLLAALKHQRRQSRAVRAAMQSLQQLRLGA
jgi:hypothetical protein